MEKQVRIQQRITTHSLRDLNVENAANLFTTTEPYKNIDNHIINGVQEYSNVQHVMLHVNLNEDYDSMLSLITVRGKIVIPL